MNNFYRKLSFLAMLLVVFTVEIHGQPIFADIAVSNTSCSSGCLSGVENPSFSSDGKMNTYSLLKNSLGIGATVEITTGFSNTGDPGSMIVVPIKKSASLLDASLLSLLTVEVLDISNNVIVQKVGVGLLDIGVLSSTDNSYSITLFAPPSGTFQISKVRVKLGGLASVMTSLYVGDAFYIEPTGSNCGMKFATTYNDGGSGICVLCDVSHPERAADGDFTNYSEIKVTVGVAATRYLELGWASGGQAGDYVGVIMGTGIGLLDVSLLGNVTLTLYNGTSAIQTVTASSVLGASVLSGSSQRSMIGFNATSNFTSVRISMSAVLGLINTMRIYGAVTFDPTPPLVNISLSPNHTTICDGTSTQLNATAGFSSYRWKSGQTSSSITISDSGSYAVTVLDASGCPFYSSPVTISLLPKPFVPTVTLDAFNCLGGNVKFQLNTTNAAFRYQVFHTVNGLQGEATAGTGSQMGLFSVPVYSSGTYRIDVLDTMNGCHNKSTTDLVVNVPLNPSTLSSNSDHSRCWVKPGNRMVHFIQPGTTRILASINPQTNDLGEVDVYSYVNATPIAIQACGTYQPWFITSVLDRRWHIEPQIQPTSNVNARLYFDYTDFTALSTVANINSNTNDDLYTISEIVLSKYSGANEDGIFENNCGNGNTNMFQQTLNGIVSNVITSFSATGRYVDFTIPSFSEFWLHGNSNYNVSPLPVSLMDFTAECVENGVEVTWTTATELNNASFTISRSADAENWEKVADIQGAGNSNEVKNYSIKDIRPISGNSYYQIHQTDIDGTTKYYDPVGVICSVKYTETSFSVYPNPSVDGFTISIQNELNENVVIEIYDITGNVVFFKLIDLHNNINNLFIQRNYLVSGIYFVNVKLSSGLIATNKIVLQ